MPPDAHLTNPIVWLCTGILMLLDIIQILVARRVVGREQFRQMRWLLAIASGIFFLLVWTSVLWWGWDWFYSYIFPAWVRYISPVFGLGYFAFGLGMGWLSLRLRGNPAVTWCLLGGVEGLLTHIYAIYGLGAANKPPIIHGVSQFSVLVFAVFEKAFYWSIILLVCMLVWRVVQHYQERKAVKQG